MFGPEGLSEKCELCDRPLTEEEMAYAEKLKKNGRCWFCIKETLEKMNAGGASLPIPNAKLFGRNPDSKRARKTASSYNYLDSGKGPGTPESIAKMMREVAPNKPTDIEIFGQTDDASITLHLPFEIEPQIKEQFEEWMKLMLQYFFKIGLFGSAGPNFVQFLQILTQDATAGQKNQGPPGFPFNIM